MTTRGAENHRLCGKRLKPEKSSSGCEGPHGEEYKVSMDVSINDLANFKAVSISTKTGMAQFGKPVDILDEGRLFRIQDLHIIWKGNVSRVEKREDKKIVITYKNGDWIEVGIVE